VTPNSRKSSQGIAGSIHQAKERMYNRDKGKKMYFREARWGEPRTPCVWAICVVVFVSSRWRCKRSENRGRRCQGFARERASRVQRDPAVAPTKLVQRSRKNACEWELSPSPRRSCWICYVPGPETIHANYFGHSAVSKAHIVINGTPHQP
jgi:hypothetical protein